MRWIIAFGRFWYDFIVGDSAELAVGGVVTLVVAALLAHAGAGDVAAWLLPLGVLATLLVSLRGSWRA